MKYIDTEKKEYKVAILDDMLPPYRIPLYNYLNNTNPDISIEVLLSSIKQGDRSWTLDNESIKFKYNLFAGMYLNIKTRHSRMGVYHFHFNPQLIKHLLSRRYDAVIISGYSSLTHQMAIVVCKILRIPTVLWYRSFDESETFLRRILKVYLNTLLRMVGAFFVPGKKSETYLRASCRLQKKKFVHVANPVDNGFYLRQKEKNQRKSPKEKIQILFVGRLIESKGILDLLEASELLTVQNPNIEHEIRIVGDGLLQSKIENLVSSKDMQNVHIIGHLNKFDLCIEYMNADIFVLPSHYEPWGLVVNEAMLFDLPVITTHGIGASDEIVVDGFNGLIIHPRQPKELMQALNHLITSSETRHVMGRKSGNLITSFGYEYTGDKFLNTIVELIG